MQKNSPRMALLAGVVLMVGCNRQDADALGKIGQLLAQRAKSLQQSAQQSKAVQGMPTSSVISEQEPK